MKKEKEEKKFFAEGEPPPQLISPEHNDPERKLVLDQPL
jgi:hypothetical protein